MFQNNNHSDFSKLGTQQLVSLDKHQEMLNNARKWNSIPKEAHYEEKPVVIRRLQLAWSTVLSVLTR